MHNIMKIYAWVEPYVNFITVTELAGDDAQINSFTTDIYL